MSSRNRLSHNHGSGRQRRSVPLRLENLENRLVLSDLAASIAVTPSFELKEIAGPNGQLIPDASAGPSGLSPQELQGAYGVNQITFGSVKGTGAGETIALIDAYNNPSFADSGTSGYVGSALYEFDKQFGLPDPPSFTIYNENGGTTGLPAGSMAGNWGIEESLDIEWAHAMAPQANIDVIACNSANFTDLLTGAETAAATLKAAVVSMSFGGDVEYSNDGSYEQTLDNTYLAPALAANPDVTFLASTGDNGAEASKAGPNGPAPLYPSVSPLVVAVGGTTLTVGSSSGNYTWVSEKGWSYTSDSYCPTCASGGGISTEYSAPSYQSDNGINLGNGFRTVPDVSADADPSTGVSVYDPYDFGSSTPWETIGGTSLASPTWAGLIAIADQGRSVLFDEPALNGPDQTLPALYALGGTSDSPANYNDFFHDITTGNNGYSAGTGYDLVTGIGSPIANNLIPALAATGTATATFDGNDNTTKGNWLGTYGSLGYDVVGAGAAGVKLPSDVTVTPSGESSYTWANPAPTTATQALEVPPSGSTRIAATWYSATSFTVDVDVTDSQSYNLELYVLDYDNSRRAEQIQFTNANTNAVLSTQTVSGFTGGAYMNYTISGNVLITFTKTGGNNAVLNGLFFSPGASASTSTGVKSSVDPSTYGQSVTFTASVSDTIGSVPTGSVEFFDGSTDLGHGTTLSGSGESATSTFTTSTLAAGTHSSITAVYTPSGNFAGSSGSMSQTVNPFALTITATGVNTVYNGTTTATVTLSADPVNGDSLTETYTSAVFSNRNAGTGKTVNVTGISISGAAASNYTFNTTATTTANITQAALTITAVTNTKVYDGTTSAAAIPTVSGLVGSDTVTNLTETYASATVGTGISLSVATYTVNDGNSGNNYSVTTVANQTGVITAGSTTATFDGTDTTTKGNWIGKYGSLGYDVVGAGSAGVKLPSDVTVTPSGESSYTWADPAPTTATQAPEVPPSGSTRIAAVWYSSTSFTVDVDVTDSQSYNLELYVLDYDNSGRAEQIQFTNANTKAVLSTQTVSGFTGGTYMNYTISGNVLITFTKTAGNNAVLSGLFFTGASSATATFDGTDTTTKGNWIGKYGSLGDDVIGAGAPGVKLPSDVTLTPSGESSYTWANPAPTTATQALEVPPSGSTRIAATWYSATSFTVDVDVTDNQSYNLELYVLDYDNSRRAEQIHFTNANTNAVLSTQTVSGFTGGAYMNYTISGNVLITFTKTGGNNAVLNGLFFDASPPPAATPAATVDAAMSKGAGIAAASQVGTIQIGALDGSSALASSSRATHLATHGEALLAAGIKSASTPVADEVGTVDPSGTDVASLLAADDQVTTRDSLVHDLALGYVSVVRRKLRATVG